MKFGKLSGFAIDPCEDQGTHKAVEKNSKVRILVLLGFSLIVYN